MQGYCIRIRSAKPFPHIPILQAKMYENHDIYKEESAKEPIEELICTSLPTAMYNSEKNPLCQE